MNVRHAFVVILAGTASLGTSVLAQTAPVRDPNQVAAKVERARLVLTSPDRYRVPIIVEPLRRVAVMAPEDGALQIVSVNIGATVREGQEIARLDPRAAMARLRIATSAVKERQAEYDQAKTLGSGNGTPILAVTEARLDAARAQAELAQIEVDSHILRAPFDGRVTEIRVNGGQYLAKGSTILTIDDVSSVRVFLPVDRSSATSGNNVSFTIEGKPATGKAQAVLPLNESQAALRELAAPFAAVWLVVPNADGALEPGQRAQSPFLPTSPIAGVPNSAMKKADDGKPIVQVIRAERVNDIPIRVLGTIGPERTQVSGPFRSSDVLITSSSVPLRPGTFIRFNEGAARDIEGVPPSADHVGEPAEVEKPLIAPIGSGGRTTQPKGAKNAAEGSTTETKRATPF